MDDGSVDIPETERKRAEELYDVHRNKLWDDIKSGTENFDSNLLTFSSGALGLSLGFIKDVVPIAKAIWLPCLYVSWAAFALCIAITMASFQVSIRALEKTFGPLKEYYLDGVADAFDKHTKSWWYRAIDWCTLAASACFATGVICTILFAGINIREARRMAEVEKKVVTVTEDMQKGLKPGGMTPLSPAQQPAPQSGGSGAPAQPNESGGKK